MEPRNYESGASESAPTAPEAPSVGYPTAGNPVAGTPATKPGPFWFHKVGESLRNLITAAELTPSDTDLTLITQAVQILATPIKSRLIAVNGYIVLDGGPYDNDVAIQWLTVPHGELVNNQEFSVTWPLEYFTIGNAFLSSTAGTLGNAGNTEGARISSISNTGAIITSHWAAALSSQGPYRVFSIGDVA